MKKIVSVFMVLFVALAALAYGASFVPTGLKLSAPTNIIYNFDGKNLLIPVTVTGTSANVSFFLYTRGKASSIKKITNGYLGWHYINNIDTCVYMSPAVSMDKGANSFAWDGKTKDKSQLVPAGDYTYYFYAFDDRSTRVPVSVAFNMPVGALSIQEKGQDGKPLAKPYFLGSYFKWAIGGDPLDKTLLETTTLALPAGWTGSGYGPISLLPNDFNYFFMALANKNSGVQGIAKWQWVPNGAAVLQTTFGESGLSTYTAALDAEPGVVTDGNYLYSGDSNHHFTDAASMIYAFDFDGSIANKVDLTKWWSNINDMKAGGQMNGGPTIYYQRNGYIYLDCHCSCIKQLVNPANMDQGDDFYVWTNRNGDYVLDHNFEVKAARPWVCNDYNVGPYTYNITSDSNMFSMCPSFDLGAVSFGLMGPDGSGVGYFSFAGETAKQKYGNAICSNGSIYDGIYTTINDPGSTLAIENGVYYVAQTSIKGSLGASLIGVEEAAPVTFAVAQNTPNPFNPATSITFTLAKAGKVTVEVFNVAGQKVDTIVNTAMSAGSHSVTWNASRFSAGIYFYTVKAGTSSRTMKMTLLK